MMDVGELATWAGWIKTIIRLVGFSKMIKDKLVADFDNLEAE